MPREPKLALRNIRLKPNGNYHIRLRDYDVIDLVANNWKLGRDRTKLSSHRISRLDKTAKN